MTCTNNVAEVYKGLREGMKDMYEATDGDAVAMWITMIVFFLIWVLAVCAGFSVVGLISMAIGWVFFSLGSLLVGFFWSFPGFIAVLVIALIFCLVMFISEEM